MATKKTETKTAPEKTAGTPNEGRMAPGAEGKGRIRRQRRPEIKADLVDGMQKLVDQAMSVSEFMGHTNVIIWKVEETGDCMQLKCNDCGRRGGIALNPMFEAIEVFSKSEGAVVKERRPKDKINGHLVTERCEGQGPQQ